MMDRATQHKMLQDPEFLHLARSKNSIAAVLTVLTLVVYYGFIFLLAFKQDFFGRKISTHVTVGIPIGIGVILLSWVFTGVYVRWANTRYDGMVESMKRKIESHDASSSR